MALAIRALGLPTGLAAGLLLFLAGGAWWDPHGVWATVTGSSVHPARMPGLADRDGIGVPTGDVLVYIVRTTLAVALWMLLGHAARLRMTASGGQ